MVFRDLFRLVDLGQMPVEERIRVWELEVYICHRVWI